MRTQKNNNKMKKTTMKMIVIMSNKYRMILTRMLCKMMRGIAVHTAHKTSFLQKRRNRS